tara:strand:+ start:50 stop:1579 length:1530 start_codon:yes stop_codon:yes gene_type:complete
MQGRQLAAQKKRDKRIKEGKTGMKISEVPQAAYNTLESFIPEPTDVQSITEGIADLRKVQKGLSLGKVTGAVLGEYLPLPKGVGPVVGAGIGGGISYGLSRGKRYLTNMLEEVFDKRVSRSVGAAATDSNLSPSSGDIENIENVLNPERLNRIQGVKDKLPPIQMVKNEEFNQLVMNLEKEPPIQYNLPSNKPTPFVSKELGEELGSDGNKLEGLTTQEIQSLGPAVKSYMKKRAYKDAATTEGYTRMTLEVNKTFEDLLGPDFDQDLVRGYMKAVSDHEAALIELQKIMFDKTGKLWDKQHANALRNLEHSGRMLGNKGLFPAFNYPDVLDQTPLNKSKVNIVREGNRPDPKARGSDFQRTLMRVLGKPLSLEESILYWYDQDMFYFWKELSPSQRQQLVDSSRTRSGGRIKSELTVAENINQALESMQFGEETMSGKLGRKMTDEEKLQALVDNATNNLLKSRKYKGLNLKKSPLQGNVFYDIQTGKETDYRPDMTGKGAYWDIDSE